MKRWLPFGLTLVLLCALGGCRASHEAVAADSVAIMNEVCDVLDGVTDQASATAAIPKIEKLGARMRELVEQLNKIGTPPTVVEAKRLYDKYSGPQNQMNGRLTANLPKLQKYPDLQKAYAKAMAGTNLAFVPRPYSPANDPFDDPRLNRPPGSR